MKYKNYLKNINGYTDKTIEVYQKYALELEKNNLDYEVMIEKHQHNSNSSKRLILSAIKKYYMFLGDSRAKEIKLPKKNIVVSDYIKYEEYRNYLKIINTNTRMGFQKYIIIRLLFETGIRAGELLWISKEDIYNNKIKIKGKGNKQRIVMISKWLQTELEKYIDSIKHNRLFNFGYKNLYSKIQRIDKKRKIKPHMFRHGYAKYCNQNGVSIYDISLSMGHSSIDTTTRYINKNSDDVKIFSIFN